MWLRPFNKRVPTIKGDIVITINKYQLDHVLNPKKITIPKDFKIIKVDKQISQYWNCIYICAMVEAESQEIELEVEFLHTGEPIPNNYNYIGTVDVGEILHYFIVE